MVNVPSKASPLLYLCAVTLCRAIEAEVCFSSSVTKVTNSNLQIVCPDERVLIYCTTSEAGLVWNLPMEQNNLIAFFADDTTSPVQRLGSITLWRDSNQPLSSHIEIPYSPELDDTNFTCASGDESQSLRYKLADSPLEPDTMNYTFLSNGYVKLEWSPVLVDTAGYYQILVASYLPEKNESIHQVFQTNDTSLTILYQEGMNVTVHSVNECNMKSSNYAHVEINKSEASWQEWMIVNSSNVIIVLGSVATIESVISIIVIILLGVVCYRYKHKSTTTGTSV